MQLFANFLFVNGNFVVRLDVVSLVRDRPGKQFFRLNLVVLICLSKNFTCNFVNS